METDVDEKVSWWVLPLEREYEDPFEEPEARTGAGEGDTLSHGDAGHLKELKNMINLVRSLTCEDNIFTP